MQGRKHPYTVGGAVAESRAHRIDARPYRRPVAEQPVKETASVRFRGALLPERGWIHDPVFGTPGAVLSQPDRLSGTGPYGSAHKVGDQRSELLAQPSRWPSCNPSRRYSSLQGLVPIGSVAYRLPYRSVEIVSGDDDICICCCNLKLSQSWNSLCFTN